MDLGAVASPLVDHRISAEEVRPSPGASAVGFVALWAIPFVVVRGVVRVFEATEG